MTPCPAARPRLSPRSPSRYALRPSRRQPRCPLPGRSVNINTYNNRREVGPLQASAVGPLQTAAPSLRAGLRWSYRAGVSKLGTTSMLLLFLGGSLLMAGASVAASSKVYIQTFEQVKPLFKPRRLWFDKLDHATGLRWRHWGGPRATAAGTGHLYDCIPDCASGFFLIRHVTITVSRIRVCSHGRPQYTHVVWRYQGKALPGRYSDRPNASYQGNASC